MRDQQNEEIEVITVNPPKPDYSKAYVEKRDLESEKDALKKKELETYKVMVIEGKARRHGF